MCPKKATSGDVGFNQLQPRFSSKIYQTGKGKIRLEVVKQDMLQNIPEISGNSRLRILDAGAGMGQIARWLAQLGHVVTMADISSEMLDKAKYEIQAENLEKEIRVLEASIQQLPEILRGEQFDLIILHGVIAWMQEPLSAIELLFPLLSEQGKMSVLFFNKDKLVLKWAINGQIENAMTGKAKKQRPLTPINPVGFDEVSSFCKQRKIRIRSKAGVRVFYKFFARLPDHTELLDEFLKLELQYCRQEPYASLGEHTHVILGRI